MGKSSIGMGATIALAVILITSMVSNKLIKKHDEPLYTFLRIRSRKVKA